MNKRHTRQKWTNIVLCFAMIFVCLGFCSANKGLFLSAICSALDIKRSAFSLSTSTRFIVTSIVNMFFGALVIKFGTKKLMLSGVLFLTASMIINTFASSVFVFVLSEAIAGVGYSISGTAIVGCVVSRWCPENKGTVMGVILCANGIGGALCAQIITPLIHNESNPFGYRDAYVLIAAILLVIFVLLLIFFKERKAEDSSSDKSVGGGIKTPSDGIALSVASRKCYFYIALVCIFLTGFCLQGITGISAAHMEDVGLSPAFIGTMTSVSLLALTGSKFLTGFSYDKLGLRMTITICSIAAMLCMVSLAMISNTGGGRALALAYSLLSSLALPLETVMLPLYAADLFGNRDFTKIMGIFISVNTAGYAVGTPFVNLGFDLTGSYNSVLYVCAGIMLAVTVTMQFVISRAHKVKSELLTVAPDKAE